jgi:hypothetical protein
MDDVAILIDNNGAGPTVLNASDFAFDYETGIDASVIYDRCDWPVSLESRYLWINDWTSARSGVGLTNPAINTNPLSSNFGAPTFDATYRSEFQSFELNLRKQCSDRVSVLAGFRYKDFDERLDLDVDGALNYWMTANDRYGMQIGSDIVLYDNCCRLRVEAIGAHTKKPSNGTNLGTAVWPAFTLMVPTTVRRARTMATTTESHVGPSPLNPNQKSELDTALDFNLQRFKRPHPDSLRPIRV